MKKAYLVRYGAYGDHINMTVVIKALDELGYHITFEYNYKGAQIHSYNPRINEHRYFEPYAKKTGLISEEATRRWNLRLSKLAKSKEYDLYVNFAGSLEGALISDEQNPEYFWPVKYRRAKNAHMNYYDQSMIWAGLTDKKYMGWSGELFFKKEEHDHVTNQLLPFRGKFIILWAMRGTMMQKSIYHLHEDICNMWLEKHPNTVVITTGDKESQKWEWESAIGETIAPDKGLGDGSATLIHKSGRMPFRQALNTSKYVDMVLTPETGLGIGAGAFGTPKIMLLTSAALQNIISNDKNDFSLQSNVWCSPCTRAIYNSESCMCYPTTGLPICVHFDKYRVLNRMEEIYNHHFKRKLPRTGENRPEVYM
jgi:ADP-heptose:LPS heptosyltransferase